MGPEHSCMSVMGRQRLQDPGHSLPKLFIRITLADNYFNLLSWYVYYWEIIPTIQPVGQRCLQFLAILWIPHVFKGFGPYWLLSLQVYMVKDYSYFKTSFQHQFFLKNIGELYYYIYRTSFFFSVLTLYPLYLILLLH